MHNFNNFVLMLSLSRLKNAVDKNFIEIKNQNIINFYLNPNITKNLKNNLQELNEEINKEINEEINEEINKEINEEINNSQFFNEQHKCESILLVEESNFLFNSFIHIADSAKYDSEDWYLIYDNTDELKNK
jgi:hypothetical protein